MSMRYWFCFFLYFGFVYEIASFSAHCEKDSGVRRFDTDTDGAVCPTLCSFQPYFCKFFWWLAVRGRYFERWWGGLNICVMSLCSTTETIRHYRAAVRRSGRELNKGSKNGGRWDSERRPPVKDVVLNMHANVKDVWRCLKWTYFFLYVEGE